jgi:hypothetical protein
MTLRYTNNSPDALDVLWIKTEQGRKEGIGRFAQSVKGAFVPVKLEDHGLDTKVTLAQPIKAGETAQFQVAWQFVVDGAMGIVSDGKVYEIAMWYPRVSVYDDVKGWNNQSNDEVFLEYGDYVMEVTVPAGYIVAATGTLDNRSKVLTATEISRLAIAAKSDTIIHIITAAELQSGAARPKKDGVLTWKFHAKNVRDMVWCASPEFQWDATSWHGILVQSYYPPTAASVWEEGADMARMSVQEYSERWFPYPYPQVSVVGGPIGGMEYPMLSMETLGLSETARKFRSTLKEGLYAIITHEVGHNWFPMIVGSNEYLHSWMDEGFNSFICTFSEARRYPTGGDQITHANQQGLSVLREAIANKNDGALELGQDIGNAGDPYRKTTAVLQMLRQDVMGPTLFDKGFRTYISRWAYKHPTPADFFRSMNDAAGRNLDWYWREWFLSAPKFDQSIDSVSSTTHGQETSVRVVYGNKATGVMPLLVRFTFSDGTTQDYKYPAEVWATNGKTYTVSYTFTGKTVAKIVLDPDQHLIDIDATNNSWVAK